MRKLPPLNALRAYEAAARHLSFTKAAEELNVTPGAISQQIKSLEEWLGVPVFRRHRRALLLTDDAQASLPVLRDAFDKLAAASRLMASAGGHSNRLSISVAPSFASKWLVPRLDSFREAHPEIDVWISADMDVTDFAVDDVDIAIRYGPGGYEGLVTTKLMPEKIIPVCAPSLITGTPPLRTIPDLAHHTLLHDASPDNDEDCPTWPMWLKAAGAEQPLIDHGKAGMRFNQSSLVIEAAVAGRGVALAKQTLALADLEAARLTIPFDLATPTGFSYWLVHPEAKAALPHVQTFSEWVLAEAAADQAA